ncbi:hypothetical protein [Cellvibrio sp. OA-2007]|uniref:hypothetical protein n=1 Tax=Cellvibrio sp. OA-2007 TaxID=529823 RepID=UPI000780D26F|nr:hypothetical protein [Cellvibrio sp. OA-2007]
MILRKLLKSRGLGLNLIAGACFILLLVNGWGLSWQELGGYLLALVVLLGGLIGVAALCGWILHKLRVRSEMPIDRFNKQAAANESEITEAESKEQK